MTIRRLELDPATLKAMAHPLRVQILRVLELHDEVSVTGLAKELGETTGAISYHLRQLARHGFVEEGSAEDGPPDGATGATGDEAGEGGEGGRRPVGRKRRMWRLAVDEIHMTGHALLTDADTKEAAGFLLREFESSRSRRLAHWFATSTTWPEEWQKASSDMDGTLVLDPGQTRALADELKGVLDRYRQLEPGPGARRVDVQYAVYPAAEGEPS
jgi:DNA-binding transcriptional ArsR family regulator